MDILTWFLSFSIVPRTILIVAIVAWVFICYFLSGYAEKKWGDRETGAVLGFFVPMLILMIWLSQ